MKICSALLIFSLTITLINCAAIDSQSENEISPLNEVYMFQTDDDGVTDDERGDRDKRKIGAIKLGVTNGIINFVFGKLDSFIDAKTKALHVLDEANKVKNHAYGIDNTHSATGEFLSKLISAKLQASSGSIGPVVNSATTFLTSAKSGVTGALVNKFAPLSSLSSGLVGGLSSGSGGSAGGDDNGEGGGSNTAALGGILSSGLSIVSSLSGSSGGLSNGSNGSNGDTTNDSDSSSGDDTNVNVGEGYGYQPQQQLW